MEDGSIVYEKIIASENPNRQELASSLLPAIAAALVQLPWNKTSLGMVVVGQGPGSFTGIRGAVTVARTFAYALKLPLMGFNRFEVIASCFEGLSAVILSAYHDLAYMAVLEVGSDGQTRTTMEPRCIALPELAQSLNSAVQDTAGVKHLLIDPAIQLDNLALNTGVLPSPPPVIGNLACRQAEIAWNRLSLKTGSGPNNIVDQVTGDDFPWKLVEPLYLREPSVTVKKS
jgi:tRNA threonylcarbamoyl adenosine modification protein YeaZ